MSEPGCGDSTAGALAKAAASLPRDRMLRAEAGQTLLRLGLVDDAQAPLRDVLALSRVALRLEK